MTIYMNFKLKLCYAEYMLLLALSLKWIYGYVMLCKCSENGHFERGGPNFLYWDGPKRKGE